MWSELLMGFLSCAALIIAVGAQNAFVLRQGLRREHVLPIVAICAVADSLLIAAGIAGLGALIRSVPLLIQIAWMGGAIFLLCYGVAAGRRALKATQMLPSDGLPMSLGRAVATCLAFTFLNPHVYLDTVILLGTLANQAGDDGRWWFGAGAVLASACWFLALGYGARLLEPMFKKVVAWRVLDSFVAVTMIGLGIQLIVTNH